MALPEPDHSSDRFDVAPDFTLEVQEQLGLSMPIAGAITYLTAALLSPNHLATTLCCLTNWLGNCFLDVVLWPRLHRRGAFALMAHLRLGWNVPTLGLIAYAFGPGPGWFPAIFLLAALLYTQPARWSHLAVIGICLGPLIGHKAAGGTWESCLTWIAISASASVSLPQLGRSFRRHWERARIATENLGKANASLRERQAQLELMLIEARQAAVAKASFLANMSHEIRTPLNGISGALHLLQARGGDQEQLELCGLANESVVTLTRLVTDILDFSKLEAGQLSLERVPVCLRDELARACSEFGPAASERDLSLSLELEDGVPERVQGDPLRLGQVMRNLLSNAVKFTTSGGIVVRARYKEGSVLRIEVQDTGIGMNEPTLERIFNAFEQADASTTRRFGGTGLGLAICRELVTLMNGSVGATSQPGEGSTFWLELPVLALPDCSDERGDTSARPRPATGGEESASERALGLRVLLAEDMRANRVIATKILERQGCEVICAHDGLEALERIEEDEFDLVLMDWHMPQLDGLAATRELRRREQEQGRPHLPVFALTASALPEDREACMRAGMDGFITKPIVPKELFDILSGQKRRHDS